MPKYGIKDIDVAKKNSGSKYMEQATAKSCAANMEDFSSLVAGRDGGNFDIIIDVFLLSSTVV